MEIKTQTRKWGNSIAVIIPAQIAAQEKIKENQDIVIKIEKKKPKAGVLWGFLKDWKRPTQEIKDEMRQGGLSKSDREREEKWKHQK